MKYSPLIHFLYSWINNSFSPEVNVALKHSLRVIVVYICTHVPPTYVHYVCYFLSVRFIFISLVLWYKEGIVQLFPPNLHLLKREKASRNMDE